MRLSSFSVVNYRSITNARKIQTNNMTVLVGKNNEGKSNILRALTLAMDIMKMYSSDPRSLRLSANYLKNRTRYVWERDYPLSLQERNPNGFSSIELDFELNTGDISAIRGLTGIRLSGHIPVRVSINHSSVKIDIPKRGTPAFSNVENKLKIIEYVCSKIDFNFIPAVRTEHDALRVVELLIEKQLLTLELNPEYIEATHTMERLQQDVLNGISAQLVGPLQEFLPSVRDVQIHLQKDQRRSSLRHSANVIIDDGTPTPLQQKGDGIKSLTALAMLNIPTSRDRVYKLSFYRNLQCKYHVLLDNDDAGRRAGQDAETQGLLNTRNTTYTMCNGSPNAEFEDCLEKATYVEAVLSEFGVDLNVAEFRGNKKWSDRVAECFKSQGKQWNDTMEKRVKFCVAEALPSDPAVALNQHKRSSIDALVIALNSLIA